MFICVVLRVNIFLVILGFSCYFLCCQMLDWILGILVLSLLFVDLGMKFVY